MCACVRVRVYMLVCVCVCVYMLMCVCGTRARARAHTHTHTHTNPTGADTRTFRAGMRKGRLGVRVTGLFQAEAVIGARRKGLTLVHHKQ